MPLYGSLSLIVFSTDCLSSPAHRSSQWEGYLECAHEQREPEIRNWWYLVATIPFIHGRPGRGGESTEPNHWELAGERGRIHRTKSLGACWVNHWEEEAWWLSWLSWLSWSLLGRGEIWAVKAKKG